MFLFFWNFTPSYTSQALSNVKSLTITPVGKMLKDHYSSIEISNSNNYICDKLSSSDSHYSSNHSSPKRHKSHHQHSTSSPSVTSDLESENLQIAMLMAAGEEPPNKRPRKSSESSSSSTSTSVDISPKVTINMIF